MVLRDWNKFLWHVVGARLYKPRARLYLAFDESLLDEQLGAGGWETSDRGATALLNETISLHCQPVDGGFVGLSRRPNGPFIRNNWDWVFQADEGGLSLALTFAVQQILAAERMPGVSYYTAYWRMLGAAAQETRINPFGDGGRNSFRRLWQRLREELVGHLGVDAADITFEFGRGSNKYRNLPVSQALLSEGDLREAHATIADVEKINDDVLYSALRAARLSPSGRRKVFIAPLKDALIRQIRGFVEDVTTDHGNALGRVRTRREPRCDPNLLVLFEDHELFGDTTYHCTSRNGPKSVQEILAQLFETRQCLVFEERKDYFVGTANSVLQKVGAATFILVRSDQAEQLLIRGSDDDSLPPINRHFSAVETSLVGDFALLRCQALPRELEGVDLSLDPLKRHASRLREEVELGFVGGVCVNKASNSYVVGFGPEGMHCGGTEVELGSICDLDGEATTVGAALARISQNGVSRRYMLCVAGTEVLVNTEVGKDLVLQPSFVLTTTCLLPIGLRFDAYVNTENTLEDACQVNATLWPVRRDELFRRLEAELSRRQLRWVKSDSRGQHESLSILSYLEIPRARASVIEKVIASTCLVPLPLLRELNL